MSVVRAMSQAVEPAPLEELDVPEMVDILYDIVSTGVEPTSGATVAQIEMFLHEHAREPRSRNEFHAFFAEHKIEAPRQPEPRTPLRVLAPLPTPQAPVAPVADVDAIRRANEADLRALSAPAIAAMDITDIEFNEFAPRRGNRTLLAIAIAAVALLGLGLGVVISLHQDLETARAQAAANQQTLQFQQARETALERELQQDRALLQQLKQTSDQLVRDLHPPQAAE